MQNIQKATEKILLAIEKQADERKRAILNSADEITVSNARYYVSNDGDDTNDGKTPQTAWKSLDRVSRASLSQGDGVFFRRGDLFRGGVMCKQGVTYAAYGEGPKPRIYGWDRDLADPALWTCIDPQKHIWKLKEKILDCGTLVFNEGERCSRKLIPSYIHGRFVCRGEEEKIFDVRNEMTEDLDIYHHYADKVFLKPSKGEDFPVPLVEFDSLGELYLRCDGGNPAEVFSSIEAVPKRVAFRCANVGDVRVDNICIKYCCFGVSASGPMIEGLQVTNCEIGWIGGNIQHYTGIDPNYPEGKRGTVTRYGNGVEIYGGCRDYRVHHCYVYQVYDAAMSHQITTHGAFYPLENIRYTDNLIEDSVYGIEYFLEKNNGDTQSYMKDVIMSGNVIRRAGYGWGQQRHNIHTPALIKGWSYENTCRNYVIRDNIFDRSAYRMLHLVAKERESCPVMENNIYINKLGQTLGQYGANACEEPPNHSYDENAARIVASVFGDKNAKVYYVE